MVRSGVTASVPRIKADGSGPSDFGGAMLRSVRDAEGIVIAPPAPQAPTVTAPSDTRIDITWGAVTGAAWYRLHAATPSGNTAPADGDYSQIDAAAGTALTYSETGLTAGTTRYYRVVACSSKASDSCSARSPAASVTTLPPVPATAPDARVAGTAVELAWTAGPASVEWYQLARGTLADGSDRVLITGREGQPANPQSTATHHRDANLATANRYYYWLRACNTEGCSDWSQASDPVTYVTVRLNDTGTLFAGNAADDNSNNCTSDVTARRIAARGGMPRPSQKSGVALPASTSPKWRARVPTSQPGRCLVKQRQRRGKQPVGLCARQPYRSGVGGEERQHHPGPPRQGHHPSLGRIDRRRGETAATPAGATTPTPGIPW